VTGIPIVDALLAIAAALGVRELLPRIVAILAARRAQSTPTPTTQVTVQAAPMQSVPPRRSEQIPEWMRDTWTRERAEKEAAEAAALAAEIDARRDSRERISALERANSNHVVQLGRIDYRLSAIEQATKEVSSVLGTVRDAVLVMRAQCPQCEDSDPNPAVVRGGAAAVPR
jgi:hypothetical protein